MLVAAALLAAATSLDAMVHAAVQPCPLPVADEIIVCGRRGGADERSRFLSPLPYELDEGDPRARSVARERYDLLDFDSGGANTCSTVGPGGQYGCQFKRHKAWATQRAGARDPRGPLYDK